MNGSSPLQFITLPVRTGGLAAARRYKAAAIAALSKVWA